MEDNQGSDHVESARKREADTVIAIGAGVGALSAGVALASGAVCPLCVVIVPGLIGMGVVERIRASRKNPE